MPGDVVRSVGDGKPFEGSLGLGVADEGPQRDLVARAAGDPPLTAGADEHEFVAVVTAHPPGLTDHLDAVDRTAEHRGAQLVRGHRPRTA